MEPYRGKFGRMANTSELSSLVETYKKSMWGLPKDQFLSLLESGRSPLEAGKKPEYVLQPKDTDKIGCLFDVRAATAFLYFLRDALIKRHRTCNANNKLAATCWENIGDTVSYLADFFRLLLQINMACIYPTREDATGVGKITGSGGQADFDKQEEERDLLGNPTKKLSPGNKLDVHHDDEVFMPRQFNDMNHDDLITEFNNVNEHDEENREHKLAGRAEMKRQPIEDNHAHKLAGRQKMKEKDDGIDTNSLDSELDSEFDDNEFDDNEFGTDFDEFDDDGLPLIEKTVVMPRSKTMTNIRSNNDNLFLVLGQKDGDSNPNAPREEQIKSAVARALQKREAKRIEDENMEGRPFHNEGLDEVEVEDEKEEAKFRRWKRQGWLTNVCWIKIFEMIKNLNWIMAEAARISYRCRGDYDEGACRWGVPLARAFIDEAEPIFHKGWDGMSPLSFLRATAKMTAIVGPGCPVKRHRGAKMCITDISALAWALSNTNDAGLDVLYRCAARGDFDFEDSASNAKR